MILHLFSWLFLITPLGVSLVFAVPDTYRPSVVLNRVVYSGDHLVFRSIESDRPFDNDRPINASFRYSNWNAGLTFQFEFDQSIYLERGAGQEFVIETLLAHERLRTFDCYRESSASLRRLISLCSGLIRMRELDGGERREIERFKRKPEVPSKKFSLTYERGELKAYAAELTQLKIRPFPDYFFVSFNAGSKLSSTVQIKGYEEVVFTIQSTAGDECKVPKEMHQIEVAHCRGGIRVIGDCRDDDSEDIENSKETIASH